MSMLATKGSPGDMLLQMLGGGGLMDVLQSGGNMPAPYDYFQGQGLMTDMSQLPGGMTEEERMRKAAEDMYKLEQYEKYKPADMSQMYAQAQPVQDAASMPMGQPNQNGLQSLMAMVGNLGQGERQRPGQAYMSQYLQSLMR